MSAFNEQEEFEFRLRAEREAMQQPALSWGDVPGQAISNLPGSVGNIIKGVAGAVAHPIDTAKGVLDIAAGGLQNALPESLVNAIGADKPSQEKASAVGKFYGDRYGSEEGFKRALATDPAGVMADAATVLTGGGALASKVPALNKAGQMAIRAGKAIDPLANTLKAGGKVIDAGKGIAKNALGMHTGAGGEAIEQAYSAGKAGGSKQTAFTDNMRGNVPKESVLDSVDANIQAMGRAKSDAYKAGMAKLGQDQTVLNFNDVNKAAQDAMRVSTYTGKNTGQIVSTARSTLGMQQKISELVNEWQKLDPTDFHTAEGLDALKKNLGDLRDSTQYGTPERLVADKVYHAVKNQITQQAPDYAKTMQDYQQASELLSEVRATLSNKPTASVDTQMRKIQSLMRNNVNTNYGNRLDLVKQLETQGGRDILPAVAGQALNTFTPRGLQSASTLPTAALVGMASNPVAGAAMLPLASPRLMGEAANAAGIMARYLNKGVDIPKGVLKKAGIDPTIAANFIYQANQPKQQENDMNPNQQAMMAQTLRGSDPGSTMSQAGNMDAYQQYAMQAQEAGQQPMPFQQFQQVMQQQQMQQMQGR